MLATLVQSETLRLPEDQAKALAVALHDVGKHYRLPVVSPERLALGVLLYTAGRIYLPMGVAFWREQSGAAAPVATPGGPGAAATAPAAPAAATGAWFDPQALPPSLVN